MLMNIKRKASISSDKRCMVGNFGLVNRMYWRGQKKLRCQGNKKMGDDNCRDKLDNFGG